MSDKLTMSLDDSIKKSKEGSGRGGKRGGFRGGRGGKFERREGDSFRRRGGRGGGRGDRGDRRGGRGGRRFGNRDRDRGGFRGRDRERGGRSFREGRDKDEGRNRPTKVALARRFIRRTGAAAGAGADRPARPARPAREREENGGRQPDRPISERRRLRVSNLDFNITHKDLMELFSKLGTITKNKIEYDDLGRSKGTALIEYEKHEGAIKAMKEYDGAVLDGKTISVEFDDDVKAKGGSNLQRKVITKEYRERRYDDRDRERRDRGDRDRGFRRDNRDRGYRGDRERSFRRDGNRRFKSRRD